MIPRLWIKVSVIFKIVHLVMSMLLYYDAYHE